MELLLQKGFEAPGTVVGSLQKGFEGPGTVVGSLLVCTLVLCQAAESHIVAVLLVYWSLQVEHKKLLVRQFQICAYCYSIMY